MATDGDRAAALDALKRGTMSMAEAARKAGVSRMAVMKWCRAAGIDPVACRREKADREWAKSLRQTQDRRAQSPSKRELSAVAGQAMRCDDV